MRRVGGGEDGMQFGRLIMSRVFWCKRQIENADRSGDRGLEVLEFMFD
jgi:hypothetical protein